MSNSLIPLDSTGLGTRLEPIDLLGRAKLLQGNSVQSSFARIQPNNFLYKSLSSWSYNIAIGCRHACRFCYVPDSQQGGAGKEKENKGPMATILRDYGVHDADGEWGKYVLFRPWDEDVFLTSLRRAEAVPSDRLKRDGNRAVIFCSTTDPYQAVTIPGNPEKQKLLNQHARALVRRALELILKHSTLNVRILTRSPQAEKDFDLFQKFGNRLLFGMSLPTLRQDLLNVYEPGAPSAQSRLKTLQAAAKAKIPLYVAVAPTYPDLEESDLRQVLSEIKPLGPLTVFHESINIRAENVKRIADHAAQLNPPVRLRTDVFDNSLSWRNYAVNQLQQVQQIAGELEMEHCLHLWPDKALRSRSAFMKARKQLRRSCEPPTRYQKAARLAEDEEQFAKFTVWLDYWHHRISEWPR